MFFCQALDNSREEVRPSKQRLSSNWIAVGSIQAECLQAVERGVAGIYPVRTGEAIAKPLAEGESGWPRF